MPATIVTYTNGATERFPDESLSVARANGEPVTVSALAPGDLRIHSLLGAVEVLTTEAEVE